MAANAVIGVAFDGTGFGTRRGDLGRRVSARDYLDFERPLHLEYFPLARR